MLHDLGAAGPAFRLRPVSDADAGFITALRADSVRSRFLHPVSPDVAAQIAWHERYATRPGDYYFIVERAETNDAEGTIGLYDVDEAAGAAEWGRWVLREGSLAAVESAALIYDIAFAQLGLERVYCRTVAANQAVVSFHRSFGLATGAVLPSHFRLGDVSYDAVEQELTRDRWETLRPSILAQAERVARVLRRTASGDRRHV